MNAQNNILAGEDLGTLLQENENDTVTEAQTLQGCTHPL